MMKLLLGTDIAESILKELKELAQGKGYRLAVVMVGDNPVSRSYVEKKKQAANSLGIELSIYDLPASASQDDIERELSSLANNESVTGIIVQLPLPSHLPTQEILDCIPLKKDPDLLSSASFGAFALGSSFMLPPTVAAVARLLEKGSVDLKGKDVVLVGAGRLVGLPLSLWLMRKGATVHVANEHTRDLPSLCSRADILVSAVGKQNLITSSMVKEGAVVIDAGTSVEAGETKGDVDEQSISSRAGMLSPVPGGVGPVTVACLLENLVKLAST